MINCNENENYNGKIDFINKTYVDQDLYMETNSKFLFNRSKTCFKELWENVIFIK